MRQALYPWNHNNHYHPFLLSQLPSPIDCALDIGCGYGAFASRLADLATHVDAVDIDADVLKEARQLQDKHTNLRFIPGDFVTQNWPTDYYHVVTSLASIHHMELVQALKQMKRVLRPGGVLAILGLYREATVGDYAVSAAGVLANLVYRDIIYRRRLTDSPQKAPVKSPTNTLREIRMAANAIIPGARVRRRLLWRYSLTWQKPITRG